MSKAKKIDQNDAAREIVLGAMYEISQLDLPVHEGLWTVLATSCHATFDMAPDASVAYRTILSAIEHGWGLHEAGNGEWRGGADGSG